MVELELGKESDDLKELMTNELIAVLYLHRPLASVACH